MTTFANRIRAVQLVVFSIILTLTSLVLGVDITLPHDRSEKFLGIETCGSSTCHGSPKPWRNATVLMRERLIWEHFDPHSNAFNSLSSARAKSIVENLNLRNGTEAPECLSCHTTYVPVAQRGEQFSLDTGVTCESCHGPGGAFLPTHIKPTANHASNIDAGMYPTDSPTHRAKLCLSCHQVNATNQFSHEYYGAGHPRLRFELETYTANQPYHFNRDSDYKRRKSPPSATYAWSKGQLVSSLNFSESLLKNVSSAGVIPELAHFECSDCHQSIADLSEIRRPDKYFGTPSVNISNLIMAHAIANTLDSDLAGSIKQDVRALIHKTHSRNLVIGSLKSLNKRLRKLDDSLEKMESKRISGLTLAKNIVSSVKELSPVSYYIAEMTAMSLSSLVVSDFEDKNITSRKLTELELTLDKIFQNLGSESAFNQRNYLKALTAFATGIENGL